MGSIHKRNTSAKKLMSLGSRVRVGGWICAVSLPKLANYSGMSAEVHVKAQIPPIF